MNFGIYFENLTKLFQYHEGSPMLFNSGAFLLLFTVFLTIYNSIYNQKTARTVYVLIFSLFFYYKASGWYVLILAANVIIDYGIAFLINNAGTKLRKQFWLIFSLTINLGLLAFFKYTNFFIENINSLAGSNLHLNPITGIFLPIGISFYTFQALSYIIDVYRGIIKPQRSLLDYAFYMTFFPHLVAGPIVRAKDFLPQVRQNLMYDRKDLGFAIFLILKGLIKKALISDYIAQYADIIYDNPSGYSGFENLMAMYTYTLQIFCDFSGYSDMAIGIAKLMGFQLGENFNSPYTSRNITEFWRRWHISLSTWLRDYVYIPMGGNRKGLAKQYMFLFLTMLIGGFWHGADWKFVLWGAAHGLGLAIHKLISKRLPDTPLIRVGGWFLTFHFVALLWIYFRASTFQIASDSIYAIFNRMDWSFVFPFFRARSELIYVLIIGYFLTLMPGQWKVWAENILVQLPIPVRLVITLIIIQAVLQFQTESVQPFIYFQF